VFSLDPNGADAMNRKTGLLAAILGLALLGGSGCASGIMHTLGSSRNEWVVPYSALKLDVEVMKEAPVLAPLVIVDVPLTFAFETVYLPFYVGGVVIDQASKAGGSR
jgi:uncharacterized protein YceK